jgi:GNAT superfamily N-acetyltransferase
VFAEAEIVIRRALREDATGFVRAHETAWDATIAPLVGKKLGELAPFADRVARYESGIDGPPSGTGAWVAEKDGEIIGLAVRSGSELRDLYVIPRAWGSGVSRRLVDAALDDVRADGLLEALLWVGEANGRARRFYEREGWLATGQRRDSTLGGAELQYRLALVDQGRASSRGRSQPPP